MTSAQLHEGVLHHVAHSLGKRADTATVADWRVALSLTIRDRIVAPWLDATREAERQGAKRVYYLSMEFLIGRLLQDAIVNLGLLDEVAAVFDEIGVGLDAVLHDEPDAALGNGGLGRLAACFMESMATIGCPAYGYGIRYEHGLFRQSFVDGAQSEAPEDWLKRGYPWEFARPEAAQHIGFGGEVADVDGRAVWTPAEGVIAQPNDVPILGWPGTFANTLRLWQALPHQIFDLSRFNKADYVGASEPETLARTISRVLYPDDSTPQGMELRLKQEFFFTAASLRDIVARFKAEHGDLDGLADKVAIQLNDTHPAIAGPELVRILHDDDGMALDAAIAVARDALAYTNHTLLPEALESWPVDLMRRLLPRHLQLIEKIDAAHAEDHPDRQVAILADGEVRMGALAFIMAHKVNGVSALHTDLMTETVFAHLNAMHPDRIVNQTNGVTPRRWVHTANTALSGLITDAIGPDWIGDLEQLSRLEPMASDAAFMEKYVGAKQVNKAALVDWMREEHDVTLDPQAIFDIQIKRLHEYKRQHMNLLEAVALWQAIHDEPNADWTPRVKIFAGKAAPGYVFAKEIIHCINDVAAILNADPVTSPYLKIAFLPNYNVTLAERLIPAADLSEQISTAGKEASGTGNMKFALNGAPTIGTLDGANVEIRERVGADSFFLFGMTAPEVDQRREIDGHAAKAIAADPRLKAALDAIGNGTFSGGDANRYRGIVDNLSGHDYFVVCSDFADYYAAQRRVDAAYADAQAWAKMAALNTARSGWFSSDRAIKGYMRDIWGATPVKVA